MKKLLSALLAFILIFTLSVSAAENKEAGETLPDEPFEQTEEADRSYVIPVRVGILYSVIIQRGGVRAVFSPIRSKVADIGLKVLKFITDVKEIKLYFKNGQTAVLPALIEVQSYDIGIFVSLNLSVKIVTAIIDLFTKKSVVEKVAFVHSDQTEQIVTLGDLNQVLGSVFGCAVDVVKRAGKAIGTFLKNLTKGVWTSPAESSGSVRDTLVNAWKQITESAGQSVKDLKDKAGDMLDNALESAGELVDNAAEKFKDFWNGLWKKKE